GRPGSRERRSTCCCWQELNHRVSEPQRRTGLSSTDGLAKPGPRTDRTIRENESLRIAVRLILTDRSVRPRRCAPPVELEVSSRSDRSRPLRRPVHAANKNTVCFVAPLLGRVFCGPQKSE